SRPTSSKQLVSLLSVSAAPGRHKTWSPTSNACCALRKRSCADPVRRDPAKSMSAPPVTAPTRIASANQARQRRRSSPRKRKATALTRWSLDVVDRGAEQSQTDDEHRHTDEGQQPECHRESHTGG